MKENKFLIILVIVLSILLAGSIGYIVAMKVNDNKETEVNNNNNKETEVNNNNNNKETEVNNNNNNNNNSNDNVQENQENNSLPETEALAIGQKLYEDLLSYFFDNIKYSTSGYLDSSKDSSCKVGIGCIPITNWSSFEEIVSKDYQYNKTTLEKYGVEMINDKPYIIDGYADYDIIDFKLSIKSQSENRIEFQNNLTTSEGKESCKLIIVKENNNWKIQDFN